MRSLFFEDNRPIIIHRIGVFILLSLIRPVGTNLRVGSRRQSKRIGEDWRKGICRRDVRSPSDGGEGRGSNC